MRNELSAKDRSALIPIWPFLVQMLDRIKGQKGQKIPAQIRSGLPYFCSRLALQGYSSLVIAKEEEGMEMIEDTKNLLQLFGPSLDCVCSFVSSQAATEKSGLLEAAVQKKIVVLAASPESLLEKTFSKRQFLDLRLELKVGKVFLYAKLIGFLAEHGFRRVEFVEAAGEFSIRGAVLDFWSSNEMKPIRLVFKEDTIESMHSFEVATQRTVQFVPETVLLPITEKNLSGTIIDFLPEKTVLIHEIGLDSDFTFFKGNIIELSLSGADSTLNRASSFMLHPAPTVRMGSGSAQSFSNEHTTFNSWGGVNWNVFRNALQQNLKKGAVNFVFCRNTGESHRLEDILDDLHCVEKEMPKILVSPLNRGFYSEKLKFSVWSFAELVGGERKIQRLPKFKMGRTLESLSEIHPGDYAVHEHFGIGKYKGLERITVRLGRNDRQDRQKEAEFLVLEYKEDDKLFVPISDFRLVQKYIGAEGKKPKLNSLDGIAWERIKQKVREEVQELAKELLQIAAQRSLLVRGSAREDARDWQNLYQEFANSFPYEETPDQSFAIREMEKDIHAQRLMDRLICGDVGYGKTEIAMRAAFLTVLRFQQVAMLVPTTILTEQHFRTFSERFAAFPVKIAMISRFHKANEQKKILEDLKQGAIDIIIGTHRLIQKDVRFKNLGLIIIDEEHRFGVKQKEFLKKLKLTADALLLSATPIPRTLSFSLGGVRDISVIETPPEGRLPIETNVGPYDEERLIEAVERELKRGGQIFYVHNRIATIENKKRLLEKLFPGMRIGIVHGRMHADALEKGMWNFLNRKWDLLLSTTIIESGLDIPSVNTLIIEDSEDFGLAQLYQLRGRVGRQREKAYCYLFFSEWISLPEDSRKRLEAIKEFSTLGSGLKLAVRDMEIRGTGNLLGDQQHGWISAVGLELYCQLLSREIGAIKEKQGMKIERDEREETKMHELSTALPEIELSVTALIPEEYVASSAERIALYKRMSIIRTVEEVNKMRAEFIDRFGPVPGYLENLLKILFLKVSATEFGLNSIIEMEQGIIFAWRFENKELPVNVAEFAKDWPGLIELLPAVAEKEMVLKILFKRDALSEGDIFSDAERFLHISAKYVKLKRL